MEKKISKQMKHTLNIMQLGKQYSAFELDASLSTLFALYERKLVDYKVYNGWSPRTGIEWQITEAGQAIKERV